MIVEIFIASLHSVGTAAVMVCAGVYLHRRGLLTTESKTGMARYTQQIAIPALFFTKIVDCPQDFSHEQCPNILDHLCDAWVLLVWPLVVLLFGYFVGSAIIAIVRPPEWQKSCILSSILFANAMGMPITLLDVIGHNFVPPGNVNHTLDPSLFQSIYVIFNPVLQWGLGGYLLAPDESHKAGRNRDDNDTEGSDEEEEEVRFLPLRRNNFSIPSLEDAGFNSVRRGMCSPQTRQINPMRRNYSIPSLEDAGFADERTGLIISTVREDEREHTPPLSEDDDDFLDDPSNDQLEEGAQPSQRAEILRILSKIGQKALQPPALGALAGFVVAANAPSRGLFVDLTHRADNAPLEWIFDGILSLAKSAIPVNMCVVGVNLSIASRRRGSDEAASHKTIASVVIGKMLIMPLIGILTVFVLKSYFWHIPEQIQFQFYLVLLMNFITPTANVVMVIAELSSGEAAKNVMASLIGAQYVVAPFLLSLTVMLCVWTAIM